jgi:hypothetical protein
MTKHSNINIRPSYADSDKLEILEYLLTGKRINQYSCWLMFHHWKCSSRISELIADGFDIQKRRIKVGRGWVTEYWMDFEN